MPRRRKQQDASPPSYHSSNSHLPSVLFRPRVDNPPTYPTPPYYDYSKPFPEDLFENIKNLPIELRHRIYAYLILSCDPFNIRAQYEPISHPVSLASLNYISLRFDEYSDPLIWEMHADGVCSYRLDLQFKSKSAMLDYLKPSEYEHLNAFILALKLFELNQIGLKGLRIRDGGLGVETVILDDFISWLWSQIVVDMNPIDALIPQNYYHRIERLSLHIHLKKSEHFIPGREGNHTIFDDWGRELRYVKESKVYRQTPWVVCVDDESWAFRKLCYSSSVTFPSLKMVILWFKMNMFTLINVMRRPSLFPWINACKHLKVSGSFQVRLQIMYPTSLLWPPTEMVEILEVLRHLMERELTQRMMPWSLSPGDYDFEGDWGLELLFAEA